MDKQTWHAIHLPGGHISRLEQTWHAISFLGGLNCQDWDKQGTLLQMWHTHRCSTSENPDDCFFILSYYVMLQHDSSLSSWVMELTLMLLTLSCLSMLLMLSCLKSHPLCVIICLAVWMASVCHKQCKCPLWYYMSG